MGPNGETLVFSSEIRRGNISGFYSIHLNADPVTNPDACTASCVDGQACTCCVNVVANDVDTDIHDVLTPSVTSLPAGTTENLFSVNGSIICFTREAGNLGEQFDAEYQISDSTGAVSNTSPVQFLFSPLGSQTCIQTGLQADINLDLLGGKLDCPNGLILQTSASVLMSNANITSSSVSIDAAGGVRLIDTSIQSAGEISVSSTSGDIILFNSDLLSPSDVSYLAKFISVYETSIAGAEVSLLGIGGDISTPTSLCVDDSSASLRDNWSSGTPKGGIIIINSTSAFDNLMIKSNNSNCQAITLVNFREVPSSDSSTVILIGEDSGNDYLAVLSREGEDSTVHLNWKVMGKSEGDFGVAFLTRERVIRFSGTLDILGIRTF